MVIQLIVYTPKTVSRVLATRKKKEKSNQAKSKIRKSCFAHCIHSYTNQKSYKLLTVSSCKKRDGKTLGCGAYLLRPVPKRFPKGSRNTKVVAVRCTVKPSCFSVVEG